jgi:N-methylhydantoinase A/oxoprolinase/acetone carboxylase beta subunit
MSRCRSHSHEIGHSESSRSNRSRGRSLAVSLQLGLDTGGTYTDAVLFDPERGVVASAKALTTKYDLAIGLGDAIEKVLAAAKGPISLVALSTTLATNAIVEGQGSPICLLLLGYEPGQLERAGLRRAMGSDPVEFIRGGHGPLGDEQQQLDIEAAERAILAHAPRVAAFAISGHFSVRNPSHENAVRALARRLTGLPVTCGHELTSKLDAPRRALTAALNARLIPQLQALIDAVRRILERGRILAPLMVVKGDGSLVTAETALERPVETILSGPAASVVGAHYLAKSGDVVIADMGGTTTDVAMLRAGRPVLNRDGAVVGGWRTMVEAVAVHSYGLGGDSELHLAEGARLCLGPRRAIPLALLAAQHPCVLSVLEDQAQDSRRIGYDGQFAVRLRPLETREAGLDPTQGRLWQALEKGPVALSTLVDGPAAQRALGRLVGRGLAAVAAFTPSDAAHGLGMQNDWSVAAAELGARIWLRRLDALGIEPIADVEGFCRRVIEQAIRQSAELLLETAVLEESDISPDSIGALGRLMVDRTMRHDRTSRGLLDLRMSLKLPLVAIGAPVGSYYPEIAKRLGTGLVIPPHAAVCNAVGAVAGGVLKRVEALITQPFEGRFRVHLPTGNQDFAGLEAAAEHASKVATNLAIAAAVAAGADLPETSVAREDITAESVGGTKLFIEARIVVTALGRPRLASG